LDIADLSEDEQELALAVINSHKEEQEEDDEKAHLV